MALAMNGLSLSLRRQSDQLLELRVLPLELLKPFGFRNVHATELGLPSVKRLLRNIVLAADIARREARLRFLQDPYDLLLTEPLPLHQVLLPENQTYHVVHISWGRSRAIRSGAIPARDVRSESSFGARSAVATERVG
jgi:hypothetical protein